MTLLDQTMRVGLKEFEQRGLIVLAAQTQQHPLFPQRKRRLLKTIENVTGIFIGIELQRGWAVLAQNSHPQSVITVQHQTFLRAPTNDTQRPDDLERD